MLRTIGAAFMAAVLGGRVASAGDAGSYDPFRHYDRAMNVLLVWGGTSMAAGVPMLFNDDGRVRRIGTQNVLWGGINTALGIGAKILNSRSVGRTSAFDKIRSFRRAMVINGMLDVGYIGTGIALMTLGKTDRLKATGLGFTIQGSFLLGFDWVNFGLTYR